MHKEDIRPMGLSRTGEKISRSYMGTQWGSGPIQAWQGWPQVKPALRFQLALWFETATLKILMMPIKYVK